MPVGCFAPPHGAHRCAAAFGWLSRSARLCAKAFYTTEAAFLGTILAYDLLAVYQGQVTAKEGWRKPSRLRAAVFVCGAVLGRAGRKLVLRFSQNGGGLAKHRALNDKAKEAKTTIAPLLPRPRRPEVDWDTLSPGGEGI